LNTESLTILLYSPYWRKWGAPHFRHSKAVHLLQAGVNLIYIRDILGHSSIQVTEIYAKADSKQKREAIESAYTSVIPKEAPSWQTNGELLEWLNSLAK